MTTAKNVCRLCLKTTTEFSPLDATNTEKFQQIVPNLKLTPATDPIVCNECKDKLDESHKLKRTCSSSNKLICFLRNYLEIDQPTELKELLKGSKKDDKLSKSNYVCRICLKGNDGEYKSFADAKTSEYGEVLVMCLSAEDEKLTLDPKLCKLCVDLLHSMHSFVQQLKDVENKIKSYSEKTSSDEVDLCKVLDFVDVKNEVETKSEVKTTQEISDEKKEEELKNVNETPSEEQKNDEVDSKEEGEVLSEEDEDDDLLYSDVPCYKFTITLLQAPQKKTYPIQKWMKKVEAYKTRHNLSDATVKQKILGMMWSMPQIQSWFTSIADVTTWEEFKDKVLYAFPDIDDYHHNVTAMVSRFKRPKETYVKYYTAKIALLERLDLSEEKVVSTLLGGVCNQLIACIGRMGRYKTREQVLAYFKSCDEKYKIKYSLNETDESVEPVKITKPSFLWVKPDQTEVKSKENKVNQQCKCCDQTGHSSSNCPLAGLNQIESVSPAQRASKHTLKQQANTRKSLTGNVIVLHDDNPDEERQKNTEAPPRSENASVSNGTATNTGPRCACCDKPGHSSMECPLLRNKTAPQPQPAPKQETKSKPKSLVKKNGATRSEKCSFCDSTGHSTKVCPLIYCKEPAPRPSKIKILLDKDRSDKKAKPPQADDLQRKVPPKRPEPKKSKQEKCSCCGKYGHKTSDCRKRESVTETPQKPATRWEPEQTPSVPTGLQKCTSCNNVGHSSLSCPFAFATGCDMSEPIESVLQPETYALKKATNRKCLCCNETGHSSLDCPLLNMHLTGQNKAETEKYEPQYIEKTPVEEPKCVCCDKTGHTAANCPFYNFFHQGLRNRDSEPPHKKPREDRNEQEKCYFCDRVGHSSVDCFRATLEQERSKIQGTSQSFGVQQPEPSFNAHKDRPKTVRCEFCNKFGHKMSDCFFAKFDRKFYETHDNSKKNHGSKQCLSCGKFGHIQYNCTKNKAPPKKVPASWPGHPRR